MNNPVYMVGIIDAKDFQEYADKYGGPVGEMFAEVGAQIVAASNEEEVLEYSYGYRKVAGIRVLTSWSYNGRVYSVQNTCERHRFPPAIIRPFPAETGTDQIRGYWGASIRMARLR